MIPNLANMLVALALTYAAILRPGTLDAQIWLLPSCAVFILLMSTWARRSDYLHWQSNTNLVLGILLLTVFLFRARISSLLSFWLVLWVGILVATLSLWAALHRPKRGNGMDQGAVARPPQIEEMI